MFVFDKSSIAFLNTWHDYTMEIFNDPEWKTRDQGTLIATAWKFGLQYHQTLPIGYNFLISRNVVRDYCGNFTFKLHSIQSEIRPIGLHIINGVKKSDPTLKSDLEILRRKINVAVDAQHLFLVLSCLCSTGLCFFEVQ